MPFIVFSMPRCRSTWLSVFLSRPGAQVGHDIGVECASADEFKARLGALAGTLRDRSVVRVASHPPD